MSTHLILVWNTGDACTQPWAPTGGSPITPPPRATATPTGEPQAAKAAGPRTNHHWDSGPLVLGLTPSLCCLHQPQLLCCQSPGWMLCSQQVHRGGASAEEDAAEGGTQAAGDCSPPPTRALTETPKTLPAAAPPPQGARERTFKQQPHLLLGEQNQRASDPSGSAPGPGGGAPGGAGGGCGA